MPFVPRLAIALFLVSVSCPLAAPLAAIPVIENPAVPPGGVQRVEATELFRIGGEDDEVFFGSIGAIRTDPDGDLYVLDTQLSEVHVYSPTGEHLRTIGGEGDGPGELRAPGDMFLDASGTVCVLQGFPGRIVKIAPDGTPVGEASHTVDGTPGRFNVLIAGRRLGDDYLLAGIRMKFSGPGQADNIQFLDRCDPTGQRLVNYTEKTVSVNYAELVIDEGASDFPWMRLAAGADGRVFAAVPRNEYAITVYGPDGAGERVIRREYESLVRDEEQLETARRIQKAIGANYPTPVQEIRIEETEPDIGGLYPMSDGSLWVITSRGGREAPEGCWIVLDVFDAEGGFEKQVALTGSHDADRDALTLLPDGRALVTVSALDSWLNQMGAVPETGAAEVDPLEIVCYRIID